MFTGIVQARGRIVAVEDVAGDRRLLIDVGDLPLSDVDIGGSVAVNGVCLTAVKFIDNGFFADVSVETLDHTTLADLQVDSAVNLEKSLTAHTALGGHWVSGHVDGVGEVIEIHSDARSVRFSIRVPEVLAKYIAHKGSICVDGTSLTVNSVDGMVFELNIIPHTLENTLFCDYQVGSRVNLEVDVIARYIERLSAYPR